MKEKDVYFRVCKLEISDPSAHKSTLIEDRFFQEMVQNEVQDLKETYGLKKAKEIVQARKPADPFNVAFEQAVWESLDRLERWNFYSESVLPGWWPILDKYIPQILEIAPDAELYIKEKFGALRLDARSETINWRAFQEIRRAAEVESEMVCEVCGAPGKLRENNGWYETLCERCNTITDRDTKYKIITEAERRWIEQQE